MMRLAEETRHVGCESRNHILAFLGAVRSFNQLAILLETFNTQVAQSFHQTGINKGRLRFRQGDTGVLVHHVGYLTEITLRERKFPSREHFLHDAWRQLVVGICHAAASSNSGTRLFSEIRQSMRFSTVKTAVTRLRIVSPASSDVGCSSAPVTAMISHTASTKSPISLVSIQITMMTFRLAASFTGKPKRTLISTTGKTVPRKLIMPLI